MWTRGTGPTALVLSLVVALAGPSLLTPARGGTPQPRPASVTVTSVASYVLTTGDVIAVSGTASANLAGSKLRLERRDGKVWSTLGTGRVSADGTYTLSVRALQAGKNQRLRVFAPRTRSTKAASAAAGTFTVYGWYYVADRFPAVEGAFREDSFEVNGVTYPRSIAQSVPSYATHVSAQINLSRSCTTFRATVGLDDEAVSTAKRSVQLHADSLEIWSREGLGLGESIPISLDVTGALRMRFDVTKSASNGAYVVYGDAELLCAF